MVSELLVEYWYVTLAALVAVYAVLQKLQKARLEKKLGAVPVEGTRTDHFMGFRAARAMLKKKKEGTMIQFVKEQFQELGHKTIAVTMAGNPMILTIDPDNIKAVLATQFNDFSLGIRHAQFLPVLGDGIFTLDGNGWKHLRTMLRPQFAREQVAHVKLLEPHVQVLAKHVRNARGNSLDLQELFFRLTVDSATEFLFGESVESLRDSSVGYSQELDIPGKFEFAEAFNAAQVVLLTRAVVQQLYFLVKGPKFARDTKIVHEYTDHFVKKVLSLSPEQLEQELKGGYTFLYELAKQTRDPKVLRDQSLNILLAGRDTTAGLLSFLFFELARNPEIFNKLREEITQLFGLGDDAQVEEITFELMKKCEYLKACINETLRMYPLVPQNFRVATRDTTLPHGGGKDELQPVLVRKGQLIVYAVLAMHRDPDYYGKDADTFRPERWFEESTRKLGWAFLPFNGGPRICLGQQFALTEALYVTVRLLQMFSQLKSYDPEYPPKTATHLTMSLFNGCQVAFAE